MSEPETLTAKEMVDRLQVHRNTLAKWVAQGLPTYRRGHERFFEWPEVVEWLKSNGHEGYLRASERGA